MLGRIVRAAELRNSGNSFQKSFMLLACADAIDIIGLNRRADTDAFFSLEKKSRRLGLMVNKDKIKYMASRRLHVLEIMYKLITTLLKC